MANINALVQQLQADADHMQIPKAGIERAHEAVEAQAAITAQHEQRLDEPTAIDLRASQEQAELRCDLTQRAVRLETGIGAQLTAVRGTALFDLVADTCQGQIDDEIIAIWENMGKVKAIVELHEAREREMAEYLGRPLHHRAVRVD